ncbi:pH-response regulator protein palA/RIM20 [Uncinocarpus reesii 1704]|uniref:pH-response regulator protein palA/RIM20 n=1 Tax=Uncinocarpus reesii (strain UAMH 1704) TaxID=336963 RepID=C4JT17_UNCRE|nr:pH-response regulator protein palA/RIM20 [Uncinocarpus reesii 1704]EEP80764.1 pH-response regulator protein palA/RIM20 [Uncinocarpus reesii 1704]
MASSILKIPFRRSHPVSLSDALAQYISSKYDQHPDMFSEDLLIINRLRTDAINVQEPHVSGISRLVMYAAQLKWISGKFPIDVGADFSWYPAFGFNTTRPVSQNNIRYELANVLFNLAALYSQLAISLNTSDPSNLKVACKYFCQSAGVIAHLRMDILPDLRSSRPEDMDEMTLRSLEELMLAQAQECFWQKAIKDGLKDASIARLAAKVSDFYANSGDSAVKSDAISTEWIHHMTAKHHHFAAAAQYRQSLDCLEKRKYGEEVARLRDSLTCVNESLKESKWINKIVLGDLNALKVRVSEDLKRAERDNDKIYLNLVPPKSELKLLERASMVAAKAPNEVTEALSLIGEGAPLGRPLFAKLVPYAVHIAASIYADRRDRLVDRTIGELESMTLRLRDLLQSLNLPGSLQALEKPLGLPPSLVSHAEEIRQQDGLNRLHRSLEDTSKLKANDRAIYTEGVELLRAEKEEDERARSKYGTDRWSRSPSEQAAEKLYTSVREIDGYLASAHNSDNLIHKKLREFERVLRVLTGTNRDLEAYVPSSKKATVTPQVERESSRLRGSLNEVARLENRRRRKIEALREKAKVDKIHSALVRETSRLEREHPMQTIEPSQFEDLFEEHLRLYDSDRDMLVEEQNNQTQIETQLREANKAFITARKGDSSTKEREKALQDLETGYIKYKEIISNIDGGRKFYNDLAKLVSRFREDCKKFVQQRRMEASQMETDITNVSAMASLNLSQPYAPIQFQSPPLNAPQPSSPSPFPAQQQEPSSPLTAPQPTRAPTQAQLRAFPPPQTPAPSGTGTMPAFPNIPSTVMAGMWTPERGIKFGAPTQMNLDSRISGPGFPANANAVGDSGDNERRPIPGTWDPTNGLRFS